jgi:hypothetical protein
MRFNPNDIESWASEYSDSPDVKHLVSLIEADRNLPQPSTLRPGSPERQLAEARQARLLKAASSLGYKPPVREVAATLAKEVAKSTALGATGLAETPLGQALEKLPVPEAESTAEKESERAKKRKRDNGCDNGFTLERKL